MAEILSRDGYTVMPWKNGRGTTSQIAIDSVESQFPDNFLWRVSSAAVTSNNTFSNFEGCRRALVVVEGSGLLLNEVELKPFVPYFFSGSEPIDCKLVSGPVVDLGVIFRAQKVSVDMEIIRADRIEMSSSSGIQFLYLAQGKAMFSGKALNQGDTVKTTSPEKIHITGSMLVGVLISIKDSSPSHIKNKTL